MTSYVRTDATKAKMRVASRKRWQDQAQRDHLSKIHTVVIPIAEIASLYQEGWSMRKIGEKFGVNADTIHRRMRQYGIPARKKGVAGHHWEEAHHNWKGVEASYGAFHNRLNTRHGKPKHCSVCGTKDPRKVYDWANLTGHYADLADYKRMCRSCHFRYDWARRRALGQRKLPRA